jgi:hypothetical protein
MLGCHIQVIPDRPEDYPLFRKKWPQFGELAEEIEPCLYDVVHVEAA